MEWLESVWLDLRYALRTLRRTPVFTAVAVSTLALGIGATSAMFSLVDGVLLRPLPFPAPDRLVQFMQSYPEKGLDNWPLSEPNVAMYRDRASDFAALAAYHRREATYTGGDRPERLNIARVTVPFFAVLGVGPTVGRPFAPDEDKPGSNNVVILAYGFWQSHFGGDQRIVGKLLDLDGQPTRVVGVMPRGFGFPRTDIAMWLPLGLNPSREFGWYLTGIARLKPGISVEHAERQTTTIMWDWVREHTTLLSISTPQPGERLGTRVTPLRDAITGDSQRPLAILQIAVVLILLIATANVATLLSGRAAARSREIGLRTALGATRGRVVRQLLTESVAVALLGAVLGIVLAIVGVRAFTHSSGATLPRIEDVAVNGRVLLFTVLVSVVSGLLFGLSPALHSMRQSLSQTMAAGPRETTHRSTGRVNDSLVIAQLALSVVLLISAGLVLKSFHRLLDVDLGFQANDVTSVAMPLPSAYTRQTATAFSVTLLDRVRAIPGVRAAAVAWSLPFSGGVTTDGFVIEGHPAPSAAGSETQTIQVGVSPGFFSTLGIKLHRGRDFSSVDRDSTVPVVIVDEALAHRYWTDGNGIGKRLQLTGDTTWRTIIGVVSSVRDEDAASESRPHTYFPLSQSPATHLTLAVRTTGDSRAAIAAVRDAISHLEPGMPLDGIRPLTDFLDRSLDRRRMTQILLTGFALLAATLAAVGIYGVMSLYVANRGREFGIRLAIGAEPRNLIRLVLGEGLILTILGLGVGVGGALLATRWIRSLLFDVSATDPIVFLLFPVTLGVLAVACCYFPARRAAKSDPMQVMRAD